MEKDLAIYDKMKLQQRNALIEKEKDKMPYFFSLQPHEQKFLEMVAFEGENLINAYNKAFRNVPGFETITKSRRAVTLFNRSSVQKAFEELSVIRHKLLVSRMGGYFEDSLERIIDIATFGGEEKVRLDANKYVVDKYLQSSKDLIALADSQGVQVNVNNSGGKVAIINVQASDMDEQERVFDGQTAKEVKNRISGSRAVVIENVDE